MRSSDLTVNGGVRNGADGCSIRALKEWAAVHMRSLDLTVNGSSEEWRGRVQYMRAERMGGGTFDFFQAGEYTISIK